jgi:hypothetical protein
MAKAVLRQIAFGLATGGLLMGCVEGAGSGGNKGSAGFAASPGRAATGREVEAPEVFQTTDSALWDGRPSLGGIWVASPDAKDPERVVMFNPATGKSVTGALFRRERDNPGPPLQISSDAAEALGMLAGQPTEIRVTALRKTDPEPAAKVAATETAPAAESAAGAPAADPAAAETAALATAALAAADGAATAGAGGAAATSEAGAVDAAAPAEPPKRKTWKERRAEAKAKREAEKAAKAAAAAAAAAETVEGEAAGAPTAESAGVVAVETAPLDARAAEVTAAAESAAGAAPAPERKKTRRQIREEEAAAAAAAAAEAAPAAPTPVAGGRPIQVASFSKEENAKRAVEALAKIGVSAQPQKSERGGTVVWGVVALGDAELLKKIKGAGFADAYFLQ